VHSAADTLKGVPRRRLILFAQTAHRRRAVAVAGALAIVSARTGRPPPPPQSTHTSQNSTPPPPRAYQIIMGIDSIGAGFNPHLLSDQSPVNAAVAALVLPSAFRPVPDPP